MLSATSRKRLLSFARDTIAAHLTGAPLPPLPGDDPLFQEKRGVFVTLRTKDGELRGCIGYIEPIMPLAEAVRRMAIEAATGDPRFPPVSPQELETLVLEISVLTVPRRVQSPDEIVMGRDGVIVRRGFRQGVFLPQVADETGWSREEFLSNLCAQKAGLHPDAWLDPDTELMVFQAEVFSEDDV